MNPCLLADEYKRWERSRAMELWQVDIVGGVRLVDGSAAKIVSGIDDHSRFAVCARVVAPATARPVCDALEAALAAHGVQEQLDVWVGHYNHERPHQAIGRVPPIERLRLAAPRPGPAESSEPAALDIGRPAPTRRVSAKGAISLAGAQDTAGAWLDGQEVEVAGDGGLVQLHHRGVLIATAEASPDPVAARSLLQAPLGGIMPVPPREAGRSVRDRRAGRSRLGADPHLPGAPEPRGGGERLDGRPQAVRA